MKYKMKAKRIKMLLRHLRDDFAQPGSVQNVVLPQSTSSTSRNLQGSVALVTGGSRGIGRGCALALAKAGATVYVTGRSADEELAKSFDIPSSSGGKIITVKCDHSSDTNTAKVFERIINEQGHIDILVNNATVGAFSTPDSKFWEQDGDFYDAWMNVGCRSHYICTCHAVRDMVKRHQPGVVVNISSFGAVVPYNSVAYAMGKTAIDRMVSDAAIQLKEHNIATISLYPGLVKTEQILMAMPRVAKSKNAENPEFVGRAVVALASDPKVVERFSGKVVIAQELADFYGFTDIEGHVPKDKVMRTLREKHMSEPPVFWFLDK